MGAKNPSSLRACWWCGSPADSREHKFKRSDLVRAYGLPPYRGDRTLIRHSEGRATEASGPTSDIFKFERTLCQKCNNERSQPFDRSYDEFISFVSDRPGQILDQMAISLRSVYGSSWEEGRDNLVRYYIKHICCRIADLEDQYHAVVDESLIEYLDGGPGRPSLELDLFVDSTLLSLWRTLLSYGDVPDAPTPWIVSLGPLYGDLFPFQRRLDHPQSTLCYGWLSLGWRVGVASRFVNPFASETVTLRTHSDFSRKAQLMMSLASVRARVGRLARRLA
jgi:hypothetical protein